jgi:predicted nucleotidyltransferase
MKKQEQIIKEIALRYFPTCVVLLFGSRARKDFSEDSDYDFIIITEHDYSIVEKRNYKAKIRKLLAQQKIPADILIQSKKEVEIKKQITGHIVKQAVKEGVQL